MSVTSRGTPLEIVVEVANGRGKPRRLVLRPGQVRQIGRGERADLSIPEDTSMSEAHFSVACDETAGRVRDLRSRNGLFVNGERASEVRLSDGDRLTAGRTDFIVRVSAASSSAAAPTVPTRKPSLIERPYAEATRDPDPDVRRAALLAAVSSRQPWLLEHCRMAARSPTPDCFEELHLLAILAEPADVPSLLAAAGQEALGPCRFELLASLGHPRAIPQILAAIGSDDAPTRTAAGGAFTKITGADIDTAAGSPAGDIAPANRLPSAERAAAAWKRSAAKIERSSRVCGGFDVAGAHDPKILDDLDRHSWQEVRLRDAWRGALRSS